MEHNVHNRPLSDVKECAAATAETMPPPESIAHPKGPLGITKAVRAAFGAGILDDDPAPAAEGDSAP